MIRLFKVPKNEYLDFYDQARFKLTWLVCATIFYIMIVFSIATVLLAPGYIPVILISFLILGGIVAIIYKTRRYELAAKLFLTLGISIHASSLFLITDMLHMVDLIWGISIVIFGYFVLGKKWGIFGLFIFAASLAFYIYFYLEINLNNLSILSPVIRAFQAVNVILSSIVLGYIIHHFVETNRHAEFQLQGANKDLIEKKTIIESQNDLNVVMLKEIHHRVKNNLQIISSLLRLQSTEITNETSKKYFTDSISRISTMALIHEKLYQTDLISVNVKSYFEDLTNELKTTYPDVGLDLSVKLNIGLDKLNLNTLVPLALLYNELFSNSVKHAFSNVKTGQIIFELNQISPEHLTFQYSDNGKWKNTTSENSFGLEMIDTFTEQLEGSFERSIEAGTNYSFELRILD